MILAPDGSPARRNSTRRRTRGWPEVYEAANRADWNGWFYLPTIDPAEQLNAMTLDALRQRTEKLYANVGAVRMLIDRLSLAESGHGMWPKWVTGQEDFDKAATDAYDQVNRDPRFFSSDASQNSYGVQYAIRRAIRRHGDCFGQLLRPTAGAVNPRLHLIPGWQCRNTGDEPEASPWLDGVLTDDLGKPISYRFTSSNAAGDVVATDVSADDVLHFHDPFFPGQRRGEPCLAPVARKLFRREDIGKALANGTLARERLGFAIEFPGDSSAGPTIEELTGDGGTETVTNSDGSSLTLKKLFGNNAGEDIQVPHLQNGAKIATVESNRPGTAVMEFQDAILREASWACGYHPEFVFFMAGIGQGTVSRAVQMSAGESIIATREFQLRPQFADRYPVYWVWQLITSGYFDRLGIKVPQNWWQIKNISPALPTVDIGREGALHDSRVATGKESIEAYHGMQGEDAGDVEDENIAALLRRARKLAAANKELERLGFAPRSLDEQWARSVNVPMAQPQAADTEDPDPSDDDAEALQMLRRF